MTTASADIERVRVWLPHETPTQARQRVRLSTGTVLATRDGYEPLAIVPNQPWRIPSSDELGDYCTHTAPAHLQACVRIVRCSPAVLRGIVAAYADSPRPSADQLAACVVLDEILARGGQAESVQINGLAEQAGGLETVTRDRQRANQFIGLHVDSWSGLPLPRRSEAQVRLCVNVGEHTRYFLFMQRPVATLGEWLTNAAKEAGERTVSLHINDVVRRYLLAHPSLPVVRVAVHPGEAYIAATDNLIHDGSTLGNPSGDRNFNLFGYFYLPV